jgi:hypothetical protein
VECEEKKWRGQLKVQAGASRQVAMPAAITPKAESRVFTAAAGSSATSTVVRTPSAVERKESKLAEQRAVPQAVVASSSGRETLKVSAPEFVLSSGLEPSQSWFSANKYILMAVLVVGLVLVAVFVLR